MGVDETHTVLMIIDERKGERGRDRSSLLCANVLSALVTVACGVIDCGRLALVLLLQIIDYYVLITKEATR